MFQGVDVMRAVTLNFMTSGPTAHLVNDYLKPPRSSRLVRKGQQKEDRRFIAAKIGW